MSSERVRADGLLSATRAGLPVEELPVVTVHLEDNASSHFRPVIDSRRVDPGHPGGAWPGLNRRTVTPGRKWSAKIRSRVARQAYGLSVHSSRGGQSWRRARRQPT